MAGALEGLADVTAVFSSRREILLKGVPVIRLLGMKETIESRLSNFGYRAEVLATEPALVVRLRSLAVTREKVIPWVNIVLFSLTVMSTLLAGAFWQGIDAISNPAMILSNPWLIFSAGFPFSISLLSILLFHEFGHYTASRIHKVNVSLPYFIPAPTIIGTFGAFIRSKSAFVNRRQLLDIAAAGPLAGVVVAIIVLIVGTYGSTVQRIPEGAAGMYFGESLLHSIIIYVVKGPLPQGQTLVINSIAFAGWVGLLVTMLNLLPIGQLDGGHIMYALFGRKQAILAYAAMVGLLVLSFWWSGWAFWLFITLVLRPAHPPTLMDEVPIGSWRKLVGYLSIAVFIICFMPAPISY
jgi:membrane-associated protease RseP (regulator of RpoE activity)